MDYDVGVRGVAQLGSAGALGALSYALNPLVSKVLEIKI